MGVRRRWRKLLIWGMLLAVATVAGAGVAAYFYATDSDTLAALIAREAPRFLPGCRLQIGRVRIRPFDDKVIIDHLSTYQPLGDRPFLALKLRWLSIRHDRRALLEGRYVPTELTATHAVLRLRRRADGTWNLQGLLADPWPDPPPYPNPRMIIENAKVELCDETGEVELLREVSLKVDAGDGRQPVAFEGSARGDAFDRLTFRGTIDPNTGRVVLGPSDLTRLVIGEALRERVPVEFRPALEKVGLDGGEVDVAVRSVAFDPAKPIAEGLHVEASARLRAGAWNCAKLPFPIDDLRATVDVNGRRLTIVEAEGRNGTTDVGLAGTVDLLGDDPQGFPLDLMVDLKDLELDERLKDWTPEPYPPLWDEYQPRGRISLRVHAVREVAGGPVGFGLTAACHNVSLTYHLFKYPLKDVQGRIEWAADVITLELGTYVGGRPLVARGTVRKPGPDASVDLTFQSDGFPVDEVLFNALRPEMRRVVADFQPRGTVKGTATLTRRPPTGPADPPEGRVEVHADLTLAERCSMKWAGMPYPIADLRGKLELHPDHWVFRDVVGRNGLAEIRGSGRVEAAGKDARGLDQFRVDLTLAATRLPFDDQLRDALPPAWRKTWEILNPTGTCAVNAEIRLAPGRPDHYHLTLVPGAETNIRLRFERVPKPGFDPGGAIEMRMERVRGAFDFLNGVVTMRGVDFQFRDAPVSLEAGSVTVADTGQFALRARRLSVNQFRVDAPLRAMMPPVMSQFAQKLDPNRPYTIYTDLGLSWSGKPGESVLCDWQDATVVFNGNAILVGSTPVQLQGQLSGLRGAFDGQALEIGGALELASLSVEGQQITELESPVSVKGGVAELPSIRGRFLGGDVAGTARVTLDQTPGYEAHLTLTDADLHAYALTLPLRQDYRGTLSGKVDLRGQGSDIRTLQGDGWASVSKANLGELPFVLKLFKSIKKLAPADATAFDSAYVFGRIRDGVANLDPIRLSGDAFSLLGQGTLGVNRDLDLRLHLVYGRDRLRLPVVSDWVRELGGQILLVRVQGTPDVPRFALEPLPGANQALRTLGRRDPDAPRPNPAPSRARR